mgnify:CR=1 FL=1
MARLHDDLERPGMRSQVVKQENSLRSADREEVGPEEVDPQGLVEVHGGNPAGVVSHGVDGEDEGEFLAQGVRCDSMGVLPGRA